MRHLVSDRDNIVFLAVPVEEVFTCDSCDGVSYRCSTRLCYHDTDYSEYSEEQPTIHHINLRKLKRKV